MPIERQSKSGDKAQNGVFYRWLVFVGALALLVRLVHVGEMRSSPFFEAPYIDAMEYDSAAWVMANGGHPPEDTAQAPLYPLFLSLVYRIFGHSYLAARVIQSLIGTGNVVMVGLLGFWVFGRGAGLSAAVVASLYWPFIFFETELLREVLFINFNLLGLCILIRTPGTKKPVLWSFLAGLCFGLSALTRESILLFVPLAAGWLGWGLRKGDQERKKASFAVVLLLAGTAAAVVPIVIGNTVSEGELTFISTQGGLNFYIGNNSEMRHFSGLQPGAEWFRLLRLPEGDLEFPTPAQRSGWYFRKAFGWIAGNPIRWGGLVVEKLWLFWTGLELFPNHDIEYYRNHSMILSLLSLNMPLGIFPFGLLGPLALFALLATRREGGTLLLALYVLYMLVSVVAFHVRSRYRLPVVPVLVCFAVEGCFHLIRLKCEKRIREFWIGLCGVLAGVLMLNVSLFETAWAKGFTTPFYLGARLAGEGKTMQAEEQFLLALELKPEFPEARQELGRLYFNNGDLDRAEEQYLKALEAWPDFVQVNYNLGILERKRGNRSEAERQFKRALEVDPQYSRALVAIGNLRADEGNFDEALKACLMAVELEPKRAVNHFRVGQIEYGLGRPKEALDRYFYALQLNPIFWQARLACACLLNELGKNKMARDNYLEVIRLHPKNETVRRAYEIFTGDEK